MLRMSARAAVFCALLSACAYAHAAPARHNRHQPPKSADATDPTCAIDFDSLAAIAHRDYAGYQTAVQVRPAALTALTDTLRRAAAAAGDAAPCHAVLSHWLSFFQDGHLWLVPNVSAPVASSGSSTRASPASDPTRPSLVALDSVTMLLRIPSFDLRYKPAIDSLLMNGATTLERIPALIIDVRGNGGGGDAAFASLIPLLYTNPIEVIGADAWASPGNAAYFRAFLKLPELSESDRDLVQRLVEEMQQRPNQFVPIDRDTVLRSATVRAMPRTVAVLFDRGSASTTEEFLLQAGQSSKTISFSRARSAGALDYANVREVALPSGRWNFRFGTSRSRRLPTRPVDRAGLTPTISIPENVADELTYVRAYLAAHMPR